jgi:hypothetical protein
MAQAVSHRLLATEARVRARLSPRRICGGQSGTGTGRFPSYSVFSCQYYSVMALGMNGRPVGGRSSETWSLLIDMNNNKKKHLLSILTVELICYCVLHWRMTGFQVYFYLDLWKPKCSLKVVYIIVSQLKL